MREQNQLLGYWKCPQGGKAEVYQTKKAGRHFYTRCACCGLMQGTGAALQQRIWDESEFIAGLSVVSPSNVVMDKSRVIESAPVVQDHPGDFDPSEPVEEKAPVDKPDIKKRLGFFAPLGALMVAVGVGVWMH